MIMVLMMVLMMAGLFAYEPKKECFEVYTSVNSVFYTEEVRVEDGVPYNSILLDDNRCFKRYLTVDLRYLKYEAERNYLKLLLNRNRVEQLKKEKERLSFNAEEERKQHINQSIEKEITEAVYEIPFVTRENFHKISKRKYEKTFIKYMKKIQKEALEKEELEKEELQPLRKLIKIENK